MTSVYPNHQIPTDGYGAHPTDRGNVATSGYGFPLQVGGLPFWFTAPVTFVGAALAMSDSPVGFVRAAIELSRSAVSVDADPVAVSDDPIQVAGDAVASSPAPVDVAADPVESAPAGSEYDRLEPEGPTWS